MGEIHAIRRAGDPFQGAREGADPPSREAERETAALDIVLRRLAAEHAELAPKDVDELIALLRGRPAPARGLATSASPPVSAGAFPSDPREADREPEAAARPEPRRTQGNGLAVFPAARNFPGGAALREP